MMDSLSGLLFTLKLGRPSVLALGMAVDEDISRDS